MLAFAGIAVLFKELNILLPVLGSGDLCWIMLDWIRYCITSHLWLNLKVSILPLFLMMELQHDSTSVFLWYDKLSF